MHECNNLFLRLLHLPSNPKHAGKQTWQLLRDLAYRTARHVQTPKEPTNNFIAKGRPEIDSMCAPALATLHAHMLSIRYLL